jgi:hypothetical protein
MQRAAVPLLVLLVLGAAVWWLWTTRPQPPLRAAATQTPAAVAQAVTPGPSSEPPAGYRLAGLAVGEPESFAAIELPDGSSHLYRVDANVPGLGRVVAITNAGAAIEGEHGNFTLKLKPAATQTPDRRRVNGEAEPATTPTARPGDRDDTAHEPTA